MITMKDIIREGHPTLREVAKEVTFPLSKEEQQISKEMMIFLENSQNPEIAEEYDLRGGVGLAAPQINVSKQIIALLVPSMDEKEEKPLLKEVMFNPRIVSHSVKEACLADGEGCLSVDREVPGYVVRHQKITVLYQDQEGLEHKARFRGYTSIVIQHEIDHLNGIMFFDYINEKQPFAISSEVKVIE